MKLLSWNIAHRDEPWRLLRDSGADVALLQEAGEPPSDVASNIEVDPAPWRTAGADVNRPWRTAIARLTDRVSVEWIPTASLEHAGSSDLPVSRHGTLAAAHVTPHMGECYTVVSMYAVWERPQVAGSGWQYADASVHRLISDVAALIGQENGHRVIVSGDLNILFGYGELGSPYWAGRYATVFARMEALGMYFVGPQAPNGRSADPWPAELPTASKNVPTFHHNRMTRAEAARQLDFAFASADLVDRMRVRAQNEPDDWGPSDHCRIWIEIGDHGAV